MSYFMLNGNDYSHIVNSLKVNKNVKYNAQTNAAGNTVVDVINTKRTIEVGIIHIDDIAMLALMRDIAGFSVEVSFRNPDTNADEVINCIIPTSSVEYYTIQSNRVLYKAMKLTFTEL